MATIDEAFKAGVERSRLSNIVTAGYKHSTVVDRVRTTISMLEIAAETSRILQGIRAIREMIATVIRTATITRAIQLLITWTRTSYLYRWLTKEPEPDVIVIDLRKTLTVGPLIALVDRIVADLTPAYRRSRLRKHTTDTTNAVHRAPIRAVSIVIAVAVLIHLGFDFILGRLNVTTLGIQAVVLLAAGLGTQIRMSWDELVETRVMQLLIAMFEPPDVEEEHSIRQTDRTQDRE